MDTADLVKNRQQPSYLGELTREEAWCTLALGGPRSIQAASVTAFPLLSSPTITVGGFRLSSLPLTLQPLCLSALTLDQFPEWGQLGSSLSLHQFLSPGREWSGFSISLRQIVYIFLCLPYSQNSCQFKIHTCLWSVTSGFPV